MDILRRLCVCMRSGRFMCAILKFDWLGLDEVIKQKHKIILILCPGKAGKRLHYNK